MGLLGECGKMKRFTTSLSSSSSCTGVLLAGSFHSSTFFEEHWLQHLPRLLQRYFPVNLQHLRDLAHECMWWFQALPKLTQQLAVVMLLLYGAGQVLPKFFLPHSVASTESIWKQKRLYTMLLSPFIHLDLMSMLFNLLMFHVMQAELMQQFGADLCRAFLLLAAVVTTALPLCTDLLTRRIHQHRPMAPIHRANRQYVGFFGVNIALMYLLSAVRPDSFLSLQPLFPQKQIHLKSILRGILIFDGLGLLLDMFFIPSNQSIGHASNLGGFLAGWLLQHILCHSPWTKRFLKWNSRYRLCKKISF